jgi:hypothetical protein
MRVAGYHAPPCPQLRCGCRKRFLSLHIPCCAMELHGQGSRPDASDSCSRLGCSLTCACLSVCPGCVWDSLLERPDTPALLKDMEGPGATWFLRWWHVARIIRLGYNVFNCDTDVFLHDDVYKYFKVNAPCAPPCRAPFTEMVVLCLAAK